MTKPMHKSDIKLSEAEKIEVYDSMSSEQKWFYGSVEEFCSRHDVYENYCCLGTYYFVDKK